MAYIEEDEVEKIGLKKWIGGFVFGTIFGAVVVYLITITWVLSILN